MGEVFEAIAMGEAGFERRVALKRLTDDHVRDPRTRRMFLDEARIAARLHHAGIVAVLDFGVLEEAPFQVLELVDGMSAADLARALAGRGEVMPLEVALHMAREVATALHHAHTARDDDGPLGIVHRDVKPGNVLLSWSGDVKLGDFGIARARANTEHTATGEVKGTDGYMAPEQASAGGSVDARADVFALGVTLLALVLGRNPLADWEPRLALRVRDELELPAELPDDVARVARRALRRDAAERFPDAGALRDALDALLTTRAAPDGRRALCALLDRFRGATRVKAGALDAFLCVDLEPGAESEGGVRTWTARAGAPGQGAPPRVGAEAGAGAHDRGPPAPSATERKDAIALPAAAPHALASGRRGRAMVVGAVLLAAAASGLYVVTRGAPAPVVPAVIPASAPLTSERIDADAPATPSASARAIAEPPANPSASAAPSSTLVATRAAATSRSAPSSGPVIASARAAEPPVEEQATTGVLAVGGEPSARVRLVVDGADRGHAPRSMKVSVGRHTVVLTHPDGRSATRTVDVTSAHTQHAPVRVLSPF
jgi:hypothetical protein